MNSLRKPLSAIAAGLLLGGGLVSAGAQGQTIPAPAAAVERVFAWVDDHPLQAGELHAAFNSILRGKFYHGKVPEGEMQSVMLEAQNQVIDAYLLAREIERQKIEPDPVAVNEELARYDARYVGSLEWQQNRENVLPGLRAELERQSRLRQLENKVKDVAVTDEEVRRYYEAQAALFTEPEKLRIQAILLQVDPSSPATAWNLARDEAQSIVARLRQGADFGEAARMHSQDKSAANGGDMGYLHQGMLPEEVQTRIDKMSLNEISEPIMVLEGIAIIRLTERVPAKTRPYAEVAERARGLLLRERQANSWQEFRESLRKNAHIRMNENQAVSR